MINNRFRTLHDRNATTSLATKASVATLHSGI